MNGSKPTSDFVIGMTLAEIFLLLLFLIWWAVAAERAATAGPDGTVSAAVLAEQVRNLKVVNQGLNKRIEDLQTDLEAIRIMYGAASAKPTDVKRAVDERISNARRGAPKCVEANTLIEADVVDGATIVRLVATADPTVLISIGNGDTTFRPGQVLAGDEVRRFLAGIAVFYAHNQQCRFDYSLNYRTDTDYRLARTTLEQYFYPTSRLVQVATR
jgi:hypothetical protein